METNGQQRDATGDTAPTDGTNKAGGDASGGNPVGGVTPAQANQGVPRLGEGPQGGPGALAPPMPHERDELHEARVALLQLRTSNHPASEALHGLIAKHEALQEKHNSLTGKPPSAHKQASTFSHQLQASHSAPNEGKPTAEDNAAQQAQAKESLVQPVDKDKTREEAKEAASGKPSHGKHK